MTRLLHTRSKIFFNNPYVVRVEYQTESDLAIEDHYRKLCKKTYMLMDGTWGHSPVIFDVLPINYAVRGYFVFQSEDDALQFKLSCDITNIRVFMWPTKIEFTIHEFVEDSTLQQTI